MGERSLKETKPSKRTFKQEAQAACALCGYYRWRNNVYQTNQAYY